MNEFYELLYLLSTRDPCTRAHLELLKGGSFKKQLEECIARKYIQVCGSNENGDDMVELTNAGKEIVDNPLKEEKL